jgi:hypothetical protein
MVGGESLALVRLCDREIVVALGLRSGTGGGSLASRAPPKLTFGYDMQQGVRRLFRCAGDFAMPLIISLESGNAALAAA